MWDEWANRKTGNVLNLFVVCFCQSEKQKTVIFVISIVGIICCIRLGTATCKLNFNLRKNLFVRKKIKLKKVVFYDWASAEIEPQLSPAVLLSILDVVPPSLSCPRPSLPSPPRLITPLAPSPGDTRGACCGRRAACAAPRRSRVAPAQWRRRAPSAAAVSRSPSRVAAPSTGRRTESRRSPVTAAAVAMLTAVTGESSCRRRHLRFTTFFVIKI